MSTDYTRWVDLNGIARISKADGNLYIRNMETNRVTVTQLNRLVDIRTDVGDVFVKLDSGHTALNTLVHGFRFENKACRDKFVDDLMEVLVGNAIYVEYPSMPKVVDIDLRNKPPMDKLTATSVVQKYLSDLADRWRKEWPEVQKDCIGWTIAYDYAMRPADPIDAVHIIELVHLAEDIIIDNTRRPISRPDEVVAAIAVLVQAKADSSGEPSRPLITGELGNRGVAIAAVQKYLSGLISEWKGKWSSTSMQGQAITTAEACMELHPHVMDVEYLTGVVEKLERCITERVGVSPRPYGIDEIFKLIKQQD